MGKTLDDARGEVLRGIESVEAATAIPHLLKGENLEGVARGVDVELLRQPVGVVAAITPFNFPAMIPLWFLPFAIACGNAFVLKPSERDPRPSELIFELIDAIDEIPRRRRSTSSTAAATRSTRCSTIRGSTRSPSSARPRPRATSPSAPSATGKRFQALGGAKNSLVVMDDAELDRRGAGDHGLGLRRRGSALPRRLGCGAGRRRASARTRSATRWSRRHRSCGSGPGSDAATDVCPLISPEARERIVDALDAAGPMRGASCSTAVASTPVPATSMIGPSIVETADRESELAREELFGPLLTLVRAADLDDALEFVNGSRYGNAGSIFTSSGAARARLPLRRRGGDARGQRRRRGAGGLVPVLGLEGLARRRPARQRARRGRVLHPHEGGDVALGVNMGGIAEQLEVGLPQPVSELARRDWDAVIVGGGHNGLSAAAYLARAGQSVLVLERRERLGGACTLERPFGGGYEISPCAYVVGLLDPVVVDELGLRRRGVEIRVADPELYIPFEDGTAFVQWLDADRTDAALREMGAPDSDLQALRDYNQTFDRIRRLLREGERDAWIGDSPTRAELEDMLEGDQRLIDIVFEASIADVLDEHFTDQRIKDALYIQGLIAAYGGPREPGTALIHLMHHMSAIDGHPGCWGYVTGGMGAISLALADAAREAGATIAAGAAGRGGSSPEVGVELEDGTRIRARSVLCNADPKVALRLLEGQGIPDDFAARLRDWKVRSPVLKFNAALSGAAALDGRGWRDLAVPGHGRRHRRPRSGAGGLRGLRARRAADRLRGDLLPDRRRPEPRAGRQAPAERVLPVRAGGAPGRRLGGDARRTAGAR